MIRRMATIEAFVLLGLVAFTGPSAGEAHGQNPHNGNFGGYAVSKAALRMATAQLAKELGGRKIRVNSVFPGWMWGPTVEDGFKARAASEGRSVAEIRAEIAQAIPLGDIPLDDDCARAIIAPITATPLRWPP